MYGHFWDRALGRRIDRPLAGYPEDLSDEDFAGVGEAIQLGNPLPAHSEEQS
jgi:hypothetical protein